MGGFAAISNRAHGLDLKKMTDQIEHRGSFMQGHVDLGHVLLTRRIWGGGWTPDKTLPVVIGLNCV
jgi:asparagine synthetase B (glutamine-hydrolysing)